MGCFPELLALLLSILEITLSCPSGFIYCADQNNICNSTDYIAYGAVNTWIYKAPINGSIVCTDGDLPTNAFEGLSPICCSKKSTSAAFNWMNDSRSWTGRLDIIPFGYFISSNFNQTYLISENGNFYARLEDDGNFKIYRESMTDWNMIWSTNIDYGTNEYDYYYIPVQTDGSLVLYTSLDNVSWASGNNPGHTNIYLIMQDDGNLVLYEHDNLSIPRPNLLWESNTTMTIQTDPLHPNVTDLYDCEDVDTARYPMTMYGQGRVNGISWGTVTDRLTKIYYTSDDKSVEFIDNDIVLGGYGVHISEYGDAWRECTPFTISDDLVINGYRMTMTEYRGNDKQFPNYLAFNISDGTIQECGSIDTAHADSGWISYDNKYLSGFATCWIGGWALDHSLFMEFSDLSLLPTPQPTAAPTDHDISSYSCPSGYIYCTNQDDNGICYSSDYVAFGFVNRWVYKLPINGSIGCNPVEFDDLNSLKLTLPRICCSKSSSSPAWNWDPVNWNGRLDIIPFNYQINSYLNQTYLVSENGNFYARLEDDGNFKIYRESMVYWNMIWSTNIDYNTTESGSYRLSLQGDGNLVLRTILPDGNLVSWTSGNNPGHTNIYLILQDDGNLVLYEHDNLSIVRPNLLWESNTTMAIQTDPLHPDITDLYDIEEREGVAMIMYGQGRVNGISSWGALNNAWITQLIYTSDDKSFEFIENDIKLGGYTHDISEYTSAGHSWVNCTTFQISDNEIINGYRLMTRDYSSGGLWNVYYLAFNTSDGIIHECGRSEYYSTDYSDSGWVNYDNKYLSGFAATHINGWWLGYGLFMEFSDVSLLPTPEPTNAPTNPPTTPPTKSPTLNPTVSPTTCLDETLYYNPLHKLSFIESVDNISKILRTDTFADPELYGNDINMSNYQQLVCNGTISCSVSTISFNNNHICNLLCSAQHSCASATVYMNNCNTAQVICNGLESCNRLEIHVGADNNMTFINCGVDNSCNYLKIHIGGVNNNVHIECIDENSCDNLYIDAVYESYDSVQLNMYSYSDNVILSNGFGYENENATKQYIKCTDNKYIKINNSDFEDTNYTQLVIDEFNDTPFPCTDVVVECYAGNDTITECLLQYNIIPQFNFTEYIIHELNTTPIDLQLNADCFWMDIHNFIEISCLGSCQTSPTENPTLSPTYNPTISTSDPTSSPSNAPSFSPSNAPSSDPTATPSQPPTNAPSIAPSNDPTIAPSQPPTSAPSIAPSSDPTTAPSDSPTFSPSNAPSFDPTNTPSQPPTNNPSAAPSTDPSNAPSVAPSDSPTYSPSSAPTRVPTDEEEYKDITKYINIIFQIKYFTANNIYFIISDILGIIHDMQEILEMNYFNADTLSYSTFEVIIEDVNGIEIDQNKENSEQELTIYDLDVAYLSEPTTLYTRIRTTSNAAGTIITRSGTDGFQESTELQFRKFFNNTNLEFTVYSDTDELEAEDINPVKEDDNDNTAIILSVIVVIGGIFISLGAFFINKKDGTKVDNAKFFAPFLISLGIYDFISDINFSIELFYHPKTEYNINNIIFLLGLASIVFIIIPFSSNILYAMRITQQKVIKKSDYAQTWFLNHLNPFILICILCAGTYPVLVLCSSRIFGLDFFNMGLLSNELHSLSKIKIRSTIYLENAPQLLIQIIFTVIIGELASATILSAIASSLSILASVIIYKAQKEQHEESEIIMYYISFKKIDIKNKNKAVDLTAPERLNIKKYKGLKQGLANSLTDIFGDSKSIEIGFVHSKQWGCLIHLQHSISKDNLQNAHNDNDDGVIQSMGSGVSIHTTPHVYAKKKYRKNQKDISDALKKHFKMDNNNKNIEFIAEYQATKKDNRTSNTYQNKGKGRGGGEVLSLSAVEMSNVLNIRTDDNNNDDDMKYNDDNNTNVTLGEYELINNNDNNNNKQPLQHQDLLKNQIKIMKILQKLMINDSKFEKLTEEESNDEDTNNGDDELEQPPPNNHQQSTAI